MKRPLYAVCPRCGNRAEIIKMIWDWDNEQNIALVKCKCGRSQIPYSESRIHKIDLLNPYMHEENNHFDLLVPPGWTPEMWQKLQKILTAW